MENIEGLKNFAANIKPVMKQLNGNKPLSNGEASSLVQFYQESIG